jgi:hypothetical protein
LADPCEEKGLCTVKRYAGIFAKFHEAFRRDGWFFIAGTLHSIFVDIFVEKRR